LFPIEESNENEGEVEVKAKKKKKKKAAKAEKKSQLYASFTKSATLNNGELVKIPENDAKPDQDDLDEDEPVTFKQLTDAGS
jgi:hypothetical protein